MSPPATDGEGQKPSEEGTRKFTFPSHQSHMLTLAKMCQENSDYTDCVIQCGDFSSNDTEEDHKKNRLRAHRLVLGSASSFLKNVFRDIPQSLPEATILVPGVKRNVCQALLDFLYTGEMKVYREETSDLQLLIETLQIDPELISVDVIKGNTHVENSKKNDQDVSNIRKEDQKVKTDDDVDSNTSNEQASSNIKDESNISSVKNAPDEDKASTKENKEMEKSEQDNDDVHKSRKRRASANETNSTDSSGKHTADVKMAKVDEDTN